MKEIEVKSMMNDPLIKMLAEYYNDPIKFSIDVLGCRPDKQQSAVLQSILT